ncbi:MAG: nucleotide exchange factor GrpE [Thermodesulfobacterium geofontis]|uniref:Protein GrpE n=1 Tax=Thermodesulfobacterium geofontis TaxID=1295609 RepID=A0A2N7Q6P5_9BACT|nr:MAG: nucleotide exchange factor GrpE [Thermodesulfobacterium geofontis]PMP93757.1 MAG: nucleotide exchange factor GrpE [Thermodesulfobacterium geofontis]
MEELVKEAQVNTQNEEPKEEIPKEEIELKKKEEEIKYWKDLALRYAAELENLKKAFKREKEEYYKFALETVFKELLSSIDNLERALEAFKQSENKEALKEGVELTLKSIIQTLRKFGLEPFIPSIGEPFKPYLHEALSTEEHPEIPNGGITKVYQKGYKLHDRIIRPALVCVCVGKKDVKEETPQEEEENIIENE